MHLFSKGSDYELVDMGTFAGVERFCWGGGGGIPGPTSLCMKPRSHGCPQSLLEQHSRDTLAGFLSSLLLLLLLLFIYLFYFILSIFFFFCCCWLTMEEQCTLLGLAAQHHKFMVYVKASVHDEVACYWTYSQCGQVLLL